MHPMAVHEEIAQNFDNPGLLSSNKRDQESSNDKMRGGTYQATQGRLQG